MDINPQGFRDLIRAIILLSIKDIYRAKRLEHKELPIFKKKSTKSQRISKRKKVQLDYDSAKGYLRWLFDDEGFEKILKEGKRRNWRCGIKR